MCEKTPNYFTQCIFALSALFISIIRSNYFFHNGRATIRLVPASIRFNSLTSPIRYLPLRTGSFRRQPTCPLYRTLLTVSTAIECMPIAVSMRKKSLFFQLFVSFVSIYFFSNICSGLSSVRDNLVEGDTASGWRPNAKHMLVVISGDL